MSLEPPDGCEAYPRCGLDVTGHCRCHPRPTLRIPRPDPVLAYVAKRRTIDALWRDADALWDAATMAERVACALACDAIEADADCGGAYAWECAAAIRARGETTGEGSGGR